MVRTILHTVSGEHWKHSIAIALSMGTDAAVAFHHHELTIEGEFSAKELVNLVPRIPDFVLRIERDSTEEPRRHPPLQGDGLSLF